VTGKRRAPSTWARTRARLTNTELDVATVDRTRRPADAYWAEEGSGLQFWQGGGAGEHGGPAPAGSRSGPAAAVWADETQVLSAVPEDETRELRGLPLRDTAPGDDARTRRPDPVARHAGLAVSGHHGGPDALREKRAARQDKAAVTRRGETAATRRDEATVAGHDETTATRRDEDATAHRDEASRPDETAGSGREPAARRRDTVPARVDGVPRPLYARALFLRNIDPGPVMCFLFFEGALAAGAALALADLVNWWAVVVLPTTVAVVVKLNDLVAGSAGRRSLTGPVAAAGPGLPDRRERSRSGDPAKEAHLEWRRGLGSELRSVGSGERDDFPQRGRPIELPRDW
jgi:hypothetical protein